MPKSEEQTLDFEDLTYKANWLSQTPSFPMIILGGFFGAISFGLLAYINPDLMQWFLVALIVVGVVLAVKSQGKLEEAKIGALKKFAAKNGFKFGETSSGGPGTLFNYGHDREVEYMVRGELGGLPFSIFTYEYTIGSGKSERTYDSTVMRFDLPRKLPHMVIDSLVEDGNWLSSTLPIKFDKSQKIDLEGDWSEYFSLYAPDKFGIDALTILAPNVMETIMKYNSLCDIEFIDDKMYFYWPDTEISPDSWSNKFFSAYEVLNKISKKITRPETLAKYSEQKINTSPGKSIRLKKSNDVSIYVVLVLLVIAAYPISAISPKLMFLPSLLFYLIPMYYLYTARKRQLAIEKLKHRVKQIP